MFISCCGKQRRVANSNIAEPYHGNVESLWAALIKWRNPIQLYRKYPFLARENTGCQIWTTGHWWVFNEISFLPLVLLYLLCASIYRVGLLDEVEKCMKPSSCASSRCPYISICLRGLNAFGRVPNRHTRRRTVYGSSRVIRGSAWCKHVSWQNINQYRYRYENISRPQVDKNLDGVTRKLLFLLYGTFFHWEIWTDRNDGGRIAHLFTAPKQDLRKW